MMKVMCTKNNLIGSKIIMWALGKASHFAIEFDYLVAHSNHRGVHFRWRNHFLKENEVVKSVDLKLSLQEEEKCFQAIGLLEFSSYDMPAFWYYAFRVLLFKLFKIQIPKTNPWNDPNKMLCVEIAKVLPDYLISGLDLSIIEPYALVSHIEARILEEKCQT